MMNISTRTTGGVPSKKPSRSLEENSSVVYSPDLARFFRVPVSIASDIVGDMAELSEKASKRYDASSNAVGVSPDPLSTGAVSMRLLLEAKGAR